MFRRSILATTLLASCCARTPVTCMKRNTAFLTTISRTFANEAPNQPKVCCTLPHYVTETVGEKLDKRVFFYAKDDPASKISPWHAIPYKASETTYHYINEIPRNTLPKYEISTKEQYNPIKQDVKNGKLREFTYGKLPFNYGCIPQTWENPNEVDPQLQIVGDNDPIDVVEISPGALELGGVYEIKILGALALIDEGEVDWKVIAVNAASPFARDMHSITDVEAIMPGLVQNIRNWFINYKTTDGKPVNELGYNGHVLDVTKTHEIIEHTHTSWTQLKEGAIPDNGLAL